MDTTEEYIRMCEKAFGKEEPKGSWVRYSFRTIITEHGYWYDGNEEEGYIPLKTQDQLQEMLKTTHLTNPYNLISFLWNILNEDKTCPEEVPCEECIKESMYWRGFKTLEQLWLAFVRKEKYSKIWNGNDWISETTH